ncbi:alpha-glucosidase/alpha-galactosidase [Pseudalkalibacillus hwajinpoensis]|uniref:alpha-glucosidase/alpha-galactosidase n=1 Tax=Guptibacillus hwajinpoensis TaxID=208199 RepID=UPI001CD3005A|nr:alpha-glucosidase/alpha-galactosidase [Pseudalkalibacillus hwajinpoensis]MCA0991359.1 alpha-glucosidase/alpha-galactosidase [Pseudalkalibacillus hwajinpoensis]
MIKVAMIGAGSVGFTRRLMMDILGVKELRDTEFHLMDINEDNLEMTQNLCEKMIQDNNLPAKIVATTNQREAIRGADYVFCMARVGGLEAFKHDVEIPLKYGVDQCVGDTLGPGGVFFALRTIPVLLDIAKDIRETAPNALFMNYSNPMAMNTWAVRRAGGVNIIGLCHGVQGGHKQIARALGYPEEEVDYVCAGINHQTWYVQVSHKGKDMLPYLAEAFEKHSELSKSEPVRLDVLRRFGYYSTESNGHLSEYLPWYRKDKEEMNKKWVYPDVWIGGRTAGYLNHCINKTSEYKEMYPKWMNGEEEYIKLGDRSHEHGSYIIEAIETGRTYRGHFNIENKGILTNLPNGSTIEVPCYVDRNGITAGYVGDLPLQCAATCRSSISVQEMAVEAALTGNRELVKLAILHDPLTAAVCSPEQVWEMVDEMFAALDPWLPQFNGEGRTWEDIPQPKEIFSPVKKSSKDDLPPALTGEVATNVNERLSVGYKDS